MNRISRSLVLHAMLCVLFLAPAARAHAADPAEVLAKAKAAAGGQAWDGVRTLHVRARIAAR